MPYETGKSSSVSRCSMKVITLVELPGQRVLYCGYHNREDPVLYVNQFHFCK